MPTWFRPFVCMLLCVAVFGTARADDEEKERQAVEAAKKAQQAAAQRAAEQRAAAVRAYYERFTAGVRDEVDPQDARERLLVLAPGGPLVLDVEMTIDGKPFRVHREKLVDEMLAAADTDGDGEATWEEALANVRFTMNRIRFANDQQREQFLKLHDRDSDGEVDRGEARLLMARYNGGGAFGLNSGSYGYRVQSNGRVVRSAGDVKMLLDRSGDGELSAEEIAAAPERLKARDANDNDLLESTELGNEAYRNVYRRNSTGPQHALLLGPAAKAENVWTALNRTYGDGKGRVTPAGFTFTAALFEQLDRDADGLLAEDEVLGLNDVQPHARLELNFGERGDAPLMKLVETGGLGEPDRQGEGLVRFAIPGFRLQLVAHGGAAPNYNFQRSADAFLSRYDENNNGYIETEEMAGNLARNFELMDADADGKVYAREIVEMYQRQLAPRMSQVRVFAAHQGNSLLEALDQSGDGRLSLREMKTSPERLAAFDKDGDGQLAAGEIPATLSLSLTRAGGSYEYVQSSGSNAGSGGARPASAAGPDWFVRMDRNGDGDVTLREFLGTEEQFNMLDTNGDGFIEPQEAEAATPSAAGR